MPAFPSEIPTKESWEAFASRAITEASAVAQLSARARQLSEGLDASRRQAETSVSGFSPFSASLPPSFFSPLTKAHATLAGEVAALHLNDTGFGAV